MAFGVVETKLTGRQLFEKNKSAFEDLTLDDATLITEESAPVEEEESEF